VGGNIRVLGGNVEIVGTVERNVLVGAGTLVIGETSQVKGQVTVGAGTAELRGKVMGGVLAAGGAMIIAGEISGPINVYLDSTGQLDVRETAKTGSTFDYYGVESVNIAEGAALAQAPVKHALPVRTDKPVWWWRFLISLFGSLVVGMVLMSLIPRKVEEAMAEAVANPWCALGWGTLWVVGVPIVSIILMVMVIGLPLAFILLPIYLIGFIVAPVMAGATLGWIMKIKSGDAWLAKQKTMLVVLLGIMIFRLAVAIPVVGGIVWLLGILWAWGAILQIQSRLIKSQR
jgi:hypothetical protein